MKHLWKNLFLADFLALHYPFTKGKGKTFWKQILSIGAKYSFWKHCTSTSCNLSLKTCILPKVTCWSVMRITWQTGITVRPFARWRWLHSHLWEIKTLLRALSQILIVFCKVRWIINRCPLAFELPSAVTRWKISGYFCQSILTFFLKRLFFRQQVLKSNPGKTAAVFSEPSKPLILLIIFFFSFPFRMETGSYSHSSCKF